MFEILKEVFEVSIINHKRNKKRRRIVYGTCEQVLRKNAI